jgi:hypothetical protein
LKHGTLIIVRILSGLRQLGVFDNTKMNLLREKWQNGDYKEVVEELLASTENAVWKQELVSLKEEL